MVNTKRPAGVVHLYPPPTLPSGRPIVAMYKTNPVIDLFPSTRAFLSFSPESWPRVQPDSHVPHEAPPTSCDAPHAQQTRADAFLDVRHVTCSAAPRTTAMIGVNFVCTSHDTSHAYRPLRHSVSTSLYVTLPCMSPPAGCRVPGAHVLRLRH